MIDFSDFIPFLKPAAKVIESVVAWRNTSVQARTHLAVADKQHETQLITAKLQYLRDRQMHDLESSRRTLEADQSRELVEFVQTAETMRHDETLAFERWRFEQQKGLQRELEALRAATRLRSASIYREAAINAAEHTKFLDHFPIQITPSTLLNDYAYRQERSERLPLLLILSPPEIEADPSRSTSIFPHSDAQIDAVVRDLLSAYEGGESRIRFLGGAWTSKARHGEVAIDTLHSALSPVPTLVVESQILGDVIEIRCGAWMGNKPREYKTLARIPFREMLRKPRLPAAGMTATDSPDPHAAEFIHALAIHHGIIAAWFADAYFLATYQVAPRLPYILGEYAAHLDPDLIRLIVQSYRQMIRSGGEMSELRAPTVSLSFARSLAHFPDGRAPSREQLMDAITSWLDVHGNGVTGTNFETAIGYIATLGDLEFLLGVQQVCELLGDEPLKRIVDPAVKAIELKRLPIKDEEGDTLHDTW